LTKWVGSNVTYTCDEGHPGPTVIFSGVPPADHACYYEPFKWHKIDLKPLGVPADAVSAEIAGHIIITHGSKEAIANVTATFRKPGSTYSHLNYQMQGIEAAKQGGIRQQPMTRVGLVNGCFEFYWRTIIQAADGSYVADIAWPEGSSYLLNLWLQAWSRKEAFKFSLSDIKITVGD
jgi:hypothetical protein